MYDSPGHDSPGNPSRAGAEPASGAGLGAAILALRRGEPVLIRDGDDGVLALAAEVATAEGLFSLARFGGGGASAVLTRRRAVSLGLTALEGLSGALRDPQDSALRDPQNGALRDPQDSALRDPQNGALLIPLDAALPAATVRRLADPASSLGTEPRGLGAPALPAEGAALAAVLLTKLASLLPAALVAPIGGEKARGWREARIEARAVFRRHAALDGLDRVAEARVPLADAEDARLVAFRPKDGGSEHLAILIGAPDPATPVLVRLHSQCFTGDLLASLRCDCGDQLRGAIAAIARAGGGILLYLAQEGRGIGLVNKLKAYELQDAGFDTFDANEQLGFDADERVYLPAAQMLRQLGFTAIRLLTNNPDKLAALERYGIRILERVPHVFPANGHNERYLRTKATRAGHLL